MVSLASLTKNVKLDRENGDKLKLTCSFQGFQDEDELNECYAYLQTKGWRLLLEAINQETLEKSITPEASRSARHRSRKGRKASPT